MTKRKFKTGTKQISNEKYNELEKAAYDKGLSISQAIEKAIDLFIEHNKTNQKEETKHE